MHSLAPARFRMYGTAGIEGSAGRPAWARLRRGEECDSQTPGPPERSRETTAAESRGPDGLRECDRGGFPHGRADLGAAREPLERLDPQPGAAGPLPRHLEPRLARIAGAGAPPARGRLDVAEPPSFRAPPLDRQL